MRNVRILGLALVSMAIPAYGQCTATMAQTEGPYWRSGSPERYDLRLSTDTTPSNWLTISGRVLDTSCNPIPYAWIDVWHADVGGNYDNTTAEYKYRGHIFANAAGEFSIQTIKPGLYPGRTRHVHIKVDGTNTATLTTQLYFPGEAQNATDGIYNAAMLLTASTLPNGSMLGTYEFHVASGQACTAPQITTQPTPPSGPIAAGGSTSFSIAYTGSGPASVRWWRSGQALSDSSHIAGARTTTLTISNADASDAGTYTCVVGNSCGAPSSNPVAITVGGGCPADLDNDGNFANGSTRDGGVDINDLLYFVDGFERGSVLVDLDNDGEPAIGAPDGGVDINDLLYFLARFEGGC